MSINCAIIVAAGKGTRMNSKINKQFLELKGKPVLYYTLKVFEDNEFIDSIILVLSKNEIEYCKKNVLDKYKIKKVIKVVQGGPTRQNSVVNGLLAAKGSDIVLIHDGARPFVNDEMIEKGIKYAETYEACACGVNPKDTIKVRGRDNFAIDTLKREELFSVQTPQCFKYDLILNTHQKALKDKFQATDDTSIVEMYNHKVYLYEGSYSNIKITTPDDLIIGEKILENI